MSAGTAQADGPPKTGGRVDAIDCARGVALIGMALYHLSWDLADFQLVPPMLPFSPPMRLFSHAVACTFLALVGVSLALAQRNRLNLPAFLRRLAIVAAAAALVTVGSLIFAPGEGIWFGILHCIVAASVLALPFIEAPAFASLLVGAAAIVIPFFVHSPLFDPPALLWIGLGKALPNTLDWYPLLPWAGVVLIGLGLSLLPGVLGRIASPKRWRASSGPARAVCFAGRHSLAFYLGHQLILFPLVWTAAASGLFPPVPPPNPDYGAFLAACERACVAGGRTADDCETSCRCVADVVERSGEAERLGADALDARRKAELKQMAEACMAR
ncbi:MAG: heparan-alpha-glucosaminide N-acetyltransferase domain-containing protein [Roseiarcus sp.]|uniref:DUF1624 domain-containing protein n=1 Tax=Roseiarcus sp. TaxID=1969460 RepID=UPI003C6B4967